MDANVQLGEIRKQIDDIDTQMLRLFTQRMRLAEQVADIKAKHGLAVLDAERERQVIERAALHVEAAYQGAAGEFMRAVMAISRERQEKILAGETGDLNP